MSRLHRVRAFLEVAQVMAKRSTCNRAQVGCVIVDEHNRVRGVGYNGNPAGMPHCIDGDCTMVDSHCITTTHAEINAMAGLQLGSYSMFCTHSPCLTCLKVGVNLGIYTWVFLTHYEDKLRDEFIKWYNNNKCWGEPIIKLWQVRLDGEDSHSLVGETSESGMLFVYPEPISANYMPNRSRQGATTVDADRGSTGVQRR